MNNYIFLMCCLIMPLLMTSCQEEDNQTSLSDSEEVRIISLSGFLTEVLVDLGYEDKIVGRDVTSVYPESIQEKPNLGHLSQLNPEAVLALNPSVIFVEKNQKGDAKLFEQFSKANIKIVKVPTSKNLSNSISAIETLREHLIIKEELAQKIETQIFNDSLKLSELLSETTEKPKVLFIYARGAGRLMIAGTNTSAEAIIEKAGGQNAIQTFEDFRVMTPEALIESAPDVILMFESGLSSLDGKSGLKSIPGIAQTKAFKNNRIIAMDGHFLTAFGPRVGKAANELATQIHQPVSISSVD